MLEIFQEINCYNVESLENICFKSYCNISITSAKKRDKMSIAITSSNFILCSLLGGSTRIILCCLFLIYIKSNHVLSSVKLLAVDIYYFSLLYARTLPGKLKPYLKANLNGNPSMYHSIQISIRLKKIYPHGKWQKHFIWMINWIYITICSEKFQSQCKEQTITTKLL